MDKSLCRVSCGPLLFNVAITLLWYCSTGFLTKIQAAMGSSSVRHRRGSLWVVVALRRVQSLYTNKEREDRSRCSDRYLSSCGVLSSVVSISVASGTTRLSLISLTLAGYGWLPDSGLFGYSYQCSGRKASTTSRLLYFRCHSSASGLRTNSLAVGTGTTCFALATLAF
jgi:hypothetical protein